MATNVVFTKKLAAASSNAIATSQSGTAGTPLTLTATPVVIDTATATNTAIGRRVVIAYTGTDTSWTIVGTIDGTTNLVTDVAVGSGGSAQSNYDFVTVSSITPAGNTTATTAGTNGVGSSPWAYWNWRGDSPLNLGFAVEVVSGSVNYTVQHTYDDPNALLGGATYPLAFNSPVATGLSATADGAYTTPIIATRVLINSGTGEIRVRFVMAGVA